MLNNDDKDIIRKEKIAKRINMSQQDYISFSNVITNKLQDFIKTTQYIALYYPINQEVDISGLNYHKICLPCIKLDSKILEFRELNKNATLEKARYNIMQPATNNAKVIPEIIIVPLVAFDNEKNRIGYGAGYYDATIKEIKKYSNTNMKENWHKIITIGVAFSFQQVKNIKIHESDEKLDYIITEKEIIK